MSWDIRCIAYNIVIHAGGTVVAWVADVRGDTGNGHARVSEPVLPLLLAAAHFGAPNDDLTFEPIEQRPILLVVANDAEAERWAEAACWFAVLCPVQVPLGAGCLNHPLANIAFLVLAARALAAAFTLHPAREAGKKESIA